MRSLLSLFIAIFACFALAAGNNRTLKTAPVLRSEAAVSHSVLATGKWKKISVTQSGLYKLTYSDIKGMGIDPDLVQIYGYGGAMLKEDFGLGDYRDDLPEVAVYKETGSDGVFNGNDYILFYAQGPISWEYDSTTSMYERVRNPYSDKGYYFVGERKGGTKTAALSAFTGTPNQQVTSFTDFQLHETERVNMGETVAGSGTGRQLFGEDFATTASQTFSFSVPNPDQSVLSKASVRFVAKNTETSSCNVYVNGTFLSSLSMYQIASSDNYTYGSAGSTVVSFTPAGDALSVQLDYFRNGNSSTHRAYLDYIVLNVRRQLKMTGASMSFRDPNSVGQGRISNFTIQNAGSKMVVFDVTDPTEMCQMHGALTGTNYSFAASSDILREYVCADLGQDILKPTIAGGVANQDIHGRDQVDMVILTPNDYLSSANALANAHASNDNLSVLVVTPEQAYNEFSSGTPDATAYRRMMKYFYDKATSGEDRPKYLLLLGDGVYDNRLTTTVFSKNTSKPNKLLTYQSEESLNGSESYVTDDYFGFLDDTEGANLASAKLDIGIGRFPVSTPEQAENAVNKTISYMQNAQKGVWKNRLLFLADNGDDHLHETQAEYQASMVEESHPEFMVNKIYVDAYKKETTVSGTTVPDANIRFSELLNAGLLLVNYTGHGSTTQWAEEKLLTVPQIKAMTNKCLPLWVTATCDFTRFDAADISGGEQVFLNANGGGIGLFTTTRIVLSSNNFLINKSFLSNIFTKNNGVRNTLGDIMNKSKGSETLKGDRNKLSFTLIGDPALKLAYPEYSAKVMQINDQDATTAQITLQALSKVTVMGKIYREDGSWAQDFNGLVYPTVLDSKEIVMSYTDESGTSGSVNTTYYDRSKVLFSGKDSVVNGCFTFTFVVPKDIRYSGKTGMLNLYACDEGGTNEAQGYYDRFVLEGTASSDTDRTGPQIKLYLNDEDFADGDVVNQMPTFMARISDENGLNTSGNGIGHDLKLVLDDSADSTYVLNNFFTADIGSYTSGVVRYVLPELSEGRHSLSFKAWDVQNNSNMDTLWFEVRKGQSPSLSDLRFAQEGESGCFVFNHDRPEVPVTVGITVYDLTGRPVWTVNRNMQTSENVSDRFVWNLFGTNGCRVANGIYICKITLTDSNGVRATGTKKIRVAAQ